MAVEKEVFYRVHSVAIGNDRLYPVEVCIQLHMVCAQTEDDDLLLSSKRVYRDSCVCAGYVSENCPTCIAHLAIHSIFLLDRNHLLFRGL